MRQNSFGARLIADFPVQNLPCFFCAYLLNARHFIRTEYMSPLFMKLLRIMINFAHFFDLLGKFLWVFRLRI